MNNILKVFFGESLFDIKNDLCNIIIILMQLQTLGLLILFAYDGNEQVEHIDEEYQSGEVENGPHEVGVADEGNIGIVGSQDVLENRVEVSQQQPVELVEQVESSVLTRNLQRVGHEGESQDHDQHQKQERHQVLEYVVHQCDKETYAF